MSFFWTKKCRDAVHTVLYCMYLAVSSNHTTAPAAPCSQNHNSLYHFPLRSYVAGVCRG